MSNAYDINSGDLNRRIVVQESTEVQGDSGQSVITWPDDITTGTARWANIKAVSGKDYVQAAELRNQVSHTITLRYFTGLSPVKHRILYGSAVFNIVTVLDIDAMHTMHQVMCLEVV